MKVRDSLIFDSKSLGEREGNFPIEVFPEKMKSIILEWYERENYMVDFAATSMISAIATAIGNSHFLRVKENWITNVSLYFILVGRPGLGKTPPLKAAYQPLREIDYERAIKYREERAVYQNLEKEEKAKAVEPVMIQTCISDFTQEAMLRTHDHNRRGIAVVVDEIMGMFNTIDRYNGSNLIELLLSSYSGEPIIVNRISSDPIIIDCPCINLIGTTQPGPVQSLFTKGYKNNGFLDRILFAYPTDIQIPMWFEHERVSKNANNQWRDIIKKITKDCPLLPKPKILSFSPQAKSYFFEWRNEMVREVNQIPDDSLIETRLFKTPQMVARLALIHQILRWACDEGDILNVDLRSVTSAVRLSEYYELSYKRVEALLSNKIILSRDEQFLEMLGNTFSTSDRNLLGEKFGLKERTTHELVNRLIEKGLVVKIKNGLYQKVQPRENVDGQDDLQNLHTCKNCKNRENCRNEANCSEHCKELQNLNTCKNCKNRENCRNETESTVIRNNLQTIGNVTNETTNLEILQDLQDLQDLQGCENCKNQSDHLQNAQTESVGSRKEVSNE